QAVGVDVGRVEQVQPGVEADVHQARRPGHVGGAPGLEELVAAAERAGAETQHRHHEPRAAQLSIFHDPVLGAPSDLRPAGRRRRARLAQTPSAVFFYRGRRPATRDNPSPSLAWAYNAAVHPRRHYRGAIMRSLTLLLVTAAVALAALAPAAGRQPGSK